jgi:hypothetical protein
LAVEDLHCGNQREAPDEPPALFVAHRQPATLPRAKEVSRRRHPAVFSQRPQRAEQVRIDIDQLAALFSSTLLEIGQRDRSLRFDQITRPEA